VRLNQVKLVGFKSFVDPTVFQLSSQLVGIVGPNGCGKSNIIDAVRWVLGESKASELRGETMQDVIFNGAGNRKPASRASVELIFSNESGRVSGHWGQFSELAVKRTLTREGASQYYINNQVVRRRDVQDVFMGTGLGVRAYAIIGQGMISRIIEAKPDELRVFLEEAAGVSQYKERRRETEHRLNDTRDNLSRVADIVQELDKNIVKLTQQAQVATQYNTLKNTLHTKQCLLAFVRQQAASYERNAFALKIESVQLQLEASIIELRQQEAFLTHTRQQQHCINISLHNAQSTVFNTTNNLTKLEADVRLYNERRHQLEANIEKQTAEKLLWDNRQVEANQQQILNQNALNELDLSLETQQAALEEAQAHGENLTMLYDEAQEHLYQIRLNYSDAQVHQATTSSQRMLLEKNQTVIKQSLSRVQQAQTNLISPNLEQLAATQVKLTDIQQSLVSSKKDLDCCIAIENEAIFAVEQASVIDKQHRLELQKLEARHLALDTVHRKMYAASHIQKWLNTHGFEHTQRFWQHIRVNNGWDIAVQSILRYRAQALFVADTHFKDLKVFIKSLAVDDFPPASIIFIDDLANNNINNNNINIVTSINTVNTTNTISDINGLNDKLNTKNLLSLSSHIRLKNPDLQNIINIWFEQVYCADNLLMAITQRKQLPNNGVWVTPEGHRVDAVSIQLFAAETLEDTALLRQNELEQLALQIKAELIQANEAESQLKHWQLNLNNAKQNKTKGYQRLTQLTQHAHQIELEHLHLQQALQQFDIRTNQLQTDEIEYTTQLQTTIEQLSQLDEQLTLADKRLYQEQLMLDDANERVKQTQLAVNTHRQREQLIYNTLQDTAYQHRNLSERLQELKRTQATAAEYILKISQAQFDAQQNLDTLDNSVVQQALPDAVKMRSEAEHILLQERQKLENLNSELRIQDERRMQLERAIDPLRNTVVALQLKEQAARLSVEQFTEQLNSLKNNSGFGDIDTNVWENQLDLPKQAVLVANIATLQKNIDALGAVNLAALQELKEIQSRYDYLNNQMQDLSSAMATLETAILTIDHETRTMLQTTFNQVNQYFGNLFPQLFGGGEASLVMAGNDILNAGVQVLAHPPGKRNSSIHLLSGGEKALTATALVFAIFQLNPAPFCLLDEVDAPLDDSNTDRFAKMVTHMSSQTQFVFISHNKIAMEMAQQLIGVTMQEQGISRIVSVDMQANHII
jgi:chromosome segregation protein